MNVRISLAVLLLSASVAGCVTTAEPNRDQQVVTNYINLAKGYLQEGYAQKAIAPLERALTFGRDRALIYSLMGLAYQQQGEPERAESAFKRAIRLDSNAPDIRHNYGHFLYYQSRFEDAYDQFSIAADDVGYANRTSSIENMGLIALEQGNTELAETNFARALRLNRDLPRANLELSNLCKLRGDLRNGWQYYLSFEKYGHQNARSLLLGYELANANNEHKKAYQYGTSLETRYPSSPELKQYRSQINE